RNRLQRPQPKPPPPKPRPLRSPPRKRRQPPPTRLPHQRPSSKPLPLKRPRQRQRRPPAILIWPLANAFISRFASHATISVLLVPLSSATKPPGNRLSPPAWIKWSKA